MGRGTPTSHSPQRLDLRVYGARPRRLGPGASICPWQEQLRSIVMSTSVYVCVSVCLSVYLSAIISLEPHM